MRKRSTVSTKPPFKCHAVFDRRDGETLVLLHGWDGKYPNARIAALDTLDGRVFVRHGDFLVAEWPWEMSLDEVFEDLGNRNYRVRPDAAEHVRFETVEIGPSDLKKTA